MSDTDHIVQPAGMTIYRIEAHGTLLGESTITAAPGVEDTTVRLHKGAGAYWLRWLDGDLDEWRIYLHKPEALAAYEAAVRNTYPLTNPDTDAPTWTSSDVAGVPTTEA